MILDKLANLWQYAGLSENFARAVTFLAEADADALVPGRNEIDGERVYANLTENTTKPGDRPYEAHERYADIQVILRGSERFKLGFDPTFGALDPAKDYRPCTSEQPLTFDLHAGQFVIFLPGEAHAPGGAAGAPAVCRKLIVKVLCK